MTPRRSLRARGVDLPIPSWMLIAATVLGAIAVGALISYRLPLGIGVLVALCYLPLALLNLPLALALWFPLIFFSYAPGVKYADHGAAIVVGLAWLGTRRGTSAGRPRILTAHRGIVAAILLYLTWMVLSLAWSRTPVIGLNSQIFRYSAVTLLFFFVTTSATTPREVRMYMAAFIAGATISAVLGLIGNGLHASTSALQAPGAGSINVGGRVEGGAGDPNLLAAGLVPAIVLAAVMLRGTIQPRVRWLLGIATVIMLVAFVGAESRGGVVGAVAAMIAALLIWRGRRLRVLAICVLAAVLVGVWFAETPSAAGRFASITSDQGTGRTDEWLVGWRISKTHPIVGVGIDNFTYVESEYVREPGSLQYVRLIVDVPHVAHNTYLQILAETGIIGLGLFLTFVIGSLRACLRAARNFRRAGEGVLADLARGVFVGTIGLLVASIFLTNGYDSRLWMLLALGPVLRMISRRALAF